MYHKDTLLKALTNFAAENFPTNQPELATEVENLVNLANQTGSKIRHYIGFEISGQIHLGTGMAAALKIKDLTLAGVECNIWLADYHTYLNKKLDGKLETIRAVAKEYFGPVMLECCRLVGADMNLVNLLYADEVYSKPKNERTIFDYLLVFAKELTLNRVLKSISITGKEAGEATDFGTLIYPVLQTADPFFMDCQIVHAGMDQRKCHVLMREVALKMEPDFALQIDQTKLKPIAVHHSLLHGLTEPTINSDGQKEVAKMSKSKPNSAIWVQESEPEIRSKIKKAYCPMPQESQTEEEKLEEQKLNPLLNWCQYLIYPAGLQIELIRPEKFGGNKKYDEFTSLLADYLAGKIHPLDLKEAMAQVLVDWLKPLRELAQGNSGLEILKKLGK